MKIFQVDAFAENVFSGNPAAIVPLDQFPDDSVMQNIAMENNLAETAFIVRQGDGFHIRWFTPTVEVDLCGHATLASAHVLYTHLGLQSEMIPFFSPRSGPLNVYRRGELLILDFPADKIEQVSITDEMKKAFNFEPNEVYKGKSDYMFVFESEEQILNLAPDLRAVAQLPVRGVIATSRGSQVDFVSRFFGPQSGIDEDPVTGSAHTTLIPFWSKRLGKEDLAAIQLSKRRGLLACKNLGERVLISGKAKTYMIGDIFL
ncbi:MAG TPA: PhzF family phenazine biosynthesis protein [Cyclobacteriaceae bacterium]|nr:PhzF family phenazine biosynthesis protein [Cyclobacteriaceae bacterium]